MKSLPALNSQYYVFCHRKMESSVKEFERPILKKSVRWIIFITMWIHCLHVSQSSDILSPSGAKISEDLQMNQV